MKDPRISARLFIKNSVEDYFRNVDGLPSDGLETIFPIFGMNDEGDMKLLGSGFFISDVGFFATAKHVLFDNEKLIPNLVGAQIIKGEKKIFIREIVEVDAHEIADVAIGLLYQDSLSEGYLRIQNKCLPLTSSIPKIGDEVMSYAFPEPKLHLNPDGGTAEFNAVILGGYIDDYFPDGRDKVMQPAECFQTSMKLLGGASGGPVSSGNGAVFGINSSGYGDEISYVTTIKNIFSLKFRDVRLPDGKLAEELSIAELADLGVILIRD